MILHARAPTDVAHDEDLDVLVFRLLGGLVSSRNGGRPYRGYNVVEEPQREDEDHAPDYGEHKVVIHVGGQSHAPGGCLRGRSRVLQRIQICSCLEFVLHATSGLSAISTHHKQLELQTAWRYQFRTQRVARADGQLWSAKSSPVNDQSSTRGTSGRGDEYSDASTRLLALNLGSGCVGREHQCSG